MSYYLIFTGLCDANDFICHREDAPVSVICVNPEYQCDDVYTCPDQSDEYDCDCKYKFSKIQLEAD